MSHHRDYARAISLWSEKWGTKNLPDLVTISFSTRMRRSLGNARIKSGRITLNAALALAPRGDQLEVLCHEVAHVAVFMLFGAHAKPHGAEWRTLIKAAGYRPSTRAKTPKIMSPPARTNRPSRVRFRCTVCQITYFASKHATRLHCAECFQSGLKVKLTPI